MPTVTVRCNAEPDCRQLRCLYALPIRTRHYQLLGIKGETPMSRLLARCACRASRRTRRSRRRRWRPGASARARRRGPRGSVRRGSRLRRACGRRNSGVSGHSGIAPGDGRGGLGLSLLVRVAAQGHVTSCWTQSVRIDGRPTSVGLGRYPVVTLALARLPQLKADLTDFDG